MKKSLSFFLIAASFLTSMSAHALNSCITGHEDDADAKISRAISIQVAQALAKNGITLQVEQEEGIQAGVSTRMIGSSIYHNLSASGLLTTARKTVLLVALPEYSTPTYVPVLKSKGVDREGNNLEAHCTLSLLVNPRFSNDTYIEVSNQITGRRILKVDLPRSITIY